METNRRWSQGLIVTGIVIALLNMALAWTMMFFGPTPHREAVAASQVTTQVESAVPVSSYDGNTYLVKMWDVFERESQAQERRSTLLLGFCFALIAIGFSLFVMGIEGAIAARAEAADFGMLAIKVGSPGIFCILLAAVLVGLSLVGPAMSPQAAPPETKADTVRAESEGKEQILRTEAEARSEVIRTEAEVKERLLDADTRAKKELLEAEVAAKERLQRLQPAAKK